MKKTYLVTGGAGFIGANFIIHMLTNHKDINIINLDALTYAANLENLKEVEKDSRYKFVKANLCNIKEIEDVFKENEIDYVVNFAAESHVDRSIKNPTEFVKTNVEGTVNLLAVSKEAWENSKGEFKQGVRFLQVSTDEVYGSLGEEGYFSETTPLDPHSPYSASKASADLFVKAYYDTFKMPVNITRCSNNYGPNQFLEKLIPLIIFNAINLKPLPIYGDGKQVRDWLYVTDHCRAIDLVIKKAKVGEVYNVGGNNEKFNIDIVKTIIKILKETVNEKISEDLIKYVEDRKGHDRRYAIDASKIKKELGWEPQINFEEGIKKTVKWYVENKEWVLNVSSKGYLKYYEEMYSKL